ncbi:MAG: M1 family metallopeptidase [Woeseiaceae bacterium]
MIRTKKLINKSAIPLVLIMLNVSCAKQGEPAAPSVDVLPGVSLELARQRAAVLSELHYRLALTIPAEPDGEIGGTIDIEFALAANVDALQLDFREEREKISGVIVNGADMVPDIQDEHIVIPATSLTVGTNKISIEFLAGDSSLNRNPEYLYTLFVPDRARTAFPLFDQPDLKATYSLTLTVPEDWTAMSNAPVATVEKAAAENVYQFARSDLISSYLFSFVAGKFEVVERDIDGRRMTMLHRETDDTKVARNVDDIFRLHAMSLDWLEEYTGIQYPYQKFGFALIPAFQYGGMEHVGAIQYRSNSLFLDESPSQTQLLGRAGLIAHETAHMWFGNLVTMEWFNDVWTKEVFANFMAAKIVNPGFPAIDHDLNFLVRHYPRAYSVDRTSGANPIRQHLPNLNEAGQMYGAIIYNKAPIMMRQLEMMIGEALFREGMQEYLEEYAFSNATWPSLINILDEKTDEDLHSWSETWVNTPGRPEMIVSLDGTDTGRFTLKQSDPAGLGRVWPQIFGVASVGDGVRGKHFSLASTSSQTVFEMSARPAGKAVLFNADGRGYGVFPTPFGILQSWDQLGDVEKGSTLINLYEDLLDQGQVDPAAYLAALGEIVADEQNQLILNLALRQISRIFWTLVPAATRNDYAAELEMHLWNTMHRQADSSKKKIFFDAFADVVISPTGIRDVYDTWSGSRVIDDLPLSENEHITLAQLLAIKMPAMAEEIFDAQLVRTKNPDNLRKLAFIAPSLSADKGVRDRFFGSLKQEENRAVESWVLDALENIHHPLRTNSSEQYILPSLELLQEIQTTGDIFFPKRWLDVTLANHRTGTAVQTVETFLGERPDYNKQLRMKILQSADMMFRANRLANADRAL